MYCTVQLYYSQEQTKEQKMRCHVQRSKLLGLGAVTTVSLLLSGCSIPDMGILKSPNEELVAAVTKGGEYAYPDVKWWERYEDKNLNRLIEAGLKNSPSIDEAFARLAKANAQSELAGAPLSPSVDANGSVTRTRQSYNNGVPSAFVPQGFKNAGKVTLDFQYELDFWGKNREGLNAALSEARASQYEAEQTRLIVSTSIAGAYADLARLYSALDDARQSADVRMETADLFQKRYEQGLENESGALQAKANYEAAEAEIAFLEEQIDLTKNGILFLVGENPDGAAHLDRPHVAKLKTLQIPQNIPANLIGHRPDILAARDRLEAGASRINVARAGYYPNINLVAFVGQQTLGLSNFFVHDSFIGGVGPAISLPIFEKGKLDGNYKGAWADYDIALAQYNASILNAIKEFADSRTSSNALGKRIERTQAALSASKKAYDVAKKRYEGGLGTYIEVLRAEDAVISNRRSLTDIRMRTLTLDIAAVKALGGGFLFEDRKN
jgi:NodT family efflux transporter outer membrane factor (OMF) lipoprotein